MHFLTFVTLCCLATMSCCLSTAEEAELGDILQDLEDQGLTEELEGELDERQTGKENKHWLDVFKFKADTKHSENVRLIWYGRYDGELYSLCMCHLSILSICCYMYVIAYNYCVIN